MPNTLNWSRNMVNAFCSLIGNECIINGNGFVKAQSIEEGSIIDTSITFELKNSN